jgi:hypothetical protein
MAGVDKDALFLKKFSGLVLTQYEAKTIMKGLHRTRNIDSGKSASFPVLGTITANRHSPGVELTGQQMNQSERIILVDDLLTADVSIYDLDEAKNHYEVLSEYTNKMGDALAQKYDKLRMQMVLLAARAAATVTGVGSGGSVITNLNYGTDADTFLAGVAKAAQTMDEKNIPDEDRHVVLKPSLWYLCVNDGSAFHRDFGNEGNGSQASGKIGEWANVRFHKSNNVPSTVVSAASGEKNAYNGDFTKTIAPVFHREAIGTVTLMQMATEMERSVSRQSYLTVSKIADGSGILRPECAVEIATP